MKKRLLALFLALLMLVPVLVSCKGDKDNGKGSSSGGTSTNAAESDDPITAYVKDLATKVDCSGKTFTYMGRDDENFPTVEEETGDILNNSVYSRQRDLEDIFGIKWSPVKTDNGDDTTDKVINEVMAGGDSYDLVQGSMITVGQPLMTSGVIQNTDAFEYIDLDKEWWVSSLRDTFSIQDQLFFLTGPIVVNHYQDATCILFNKKVTEMFGIDDASIYESVKNGKWTLDEMLNVASNIPENSSGSGVYRYLEPAGVAFIFSSGMTITKFDDEGTPYMETALPIELSNLADRLSKIFGDNSQTAQLKPGEEQGKKYGKEHMYQLFTDNEALFKFTTAGEAIDMREFDVTFGIVPMPKLNETQANYYSYASPWSGAAVYLPKTTKDVKVTDVITEAMAALSQKYIKEAYYSKMLKGQSIYDMESSDMLDIIFDTKIYDLCDIYSGGDMNQWGPFMNLLDKAIRYDNSTLASGYASQSRVASANIKYIIGKINQ